MLLIQVQKIEDNSRTDDPFEIKFVKIIDLKSPGVEKKKPNNKPKELLFDPSKKGNKNIRKIAPSKKKQVPKRKLSDFKLDTEKKVRPVEKFQELRVSADEIADMATELSNTKVNMDGTDFIINIEVPPGIPIDQLNKIEQVYYSFRRRLAIHLYNSIISNIMEYDRLNPRLPFPIVSEETFLSFGAVFDEEGDILKVQPLEKSNVARLDDLLLQSIIGMNKLHNIPKSLLDSKKQFKFSIGIKIVP